MKKSWDVGPAVTVHLIDPRTLPVNGKIQFARSGTAYQKKLEGNLVRIHPLKPWKNRRERNQWLQERAEEARTVANNLYGTYEDAAQ